MGNKLITATLHGQIKWLKECPYSWKSKAKTDLINTLSRVWKEPEPGSPIERGIKFEDTIYSVLNSSKKDIINELDCSNNFKKILYLCKEGIFQKKSKSFITVNGTEYCLYGKIDVNFPDKIIDIKTTENFNKLKYENSIQHSLYLYNEKKLRFLYLVAIFEEGKFSDFEVIEITNTLIYSRQRIEEAINYIETFFKQNKDIEKIYLEKYCYGWKTK